MSDYPNGFYWYVSNSNPEADLDVVMVEDGYVYVMCDPAIMKLAGVLEHARLIPIPKPEL